MDPTSLLREAEASGDSTFQTEKFGRRKSSKSVTANIVECYGRNRYKRILSSF